MIKKYKFQYDCIYDIIFKVDLEIYTKELALATLEFFTWHWDKDSDPITEALKKIALVCLQFSADGWNEIGIIDQFIDLEGYPRLDGSYGVTLVRIDNFEYDENNLSLEIE
jgi:hypothetical protein